MDDKPTPVKNIQNSRSITDEIRRGIESGQYMNGDQLPSERELSESYVSSRSTIRRALLNLERAGLVTRKVGSGTFVTFAESEETDLEQVIEQISPLQLIDTRIGFERQMTRLAIAHASARDIDKMSDILEKMEASPDDNERFTKLDAEFHRALAQASGNPLIVKLYDLINEVRLHSQWQAARKIVLSPQKITQYNICHKDLLEGLRRRDMDAAIAALNQHMEMAQKDLLGTI